MLHGSPSTGLLRTTDQLHATHACPPAANLVVGTVDPVVVGNYRDLFVAIATASATLVGLLFVAMSVAKGRAQAHVPVIREFRAAASLFAFSNAFSVALFGLVPGNNIGYPAAIVGVFGIFFAAAGLRTTLSLPRVQQPRRRQLTLIGALMTISVVQVIYGIALITDAHRSGALATIGDVLIASLLIGIGRAWEMVGEWDSGIVASLGRLIGQPGGEVSARQETEVANPAKEESPR